MAYCKTSIFLFCSSLMIFNVITINVFADYAEPTSRTQVNEQTDLFEQSFDNYEETSSNFELIKDKAIEDSGNKSGLSAITNKSEQELEDESSKLDDIPHHNLNKEGNQKMLEEDMIDKIHVDYERPLNKRLKKDAKKITKAQDELIDNLIGKLKEIGVECKTEKSNKILEPEYYLQVEQEQIKNIKYNQTFCEELRNKYHCSNELTLHCSDPSYIAGTLKNVTGNMTHTITPDGMLTIGVNKEKYFYNSWGSQNDYYFTFDVDNASGIEKFKLLAVSWSDHVLVELNGKMIFGSSGVKGKLEMSKSESHYRVGGDGERYFGVDRGDGIYVPANTKKYFNANPYFEAKSYLKNGKNTLHIRLVYGKGGKIWTMLHYKEKICTSWQETWSERCNIK